MQGGEFILPILKNQSQEFDCNKSNESAIRKSGRENLPIIIKCVFNKKIERRK